MRTPHRRDISARQDLLGRELRQLFDDYVQEDMPDELKRLAEKLQAAFEDKSPRPDDAAPADARSDAAGSAMAAAPKADSAPQGARAASGVRAGPSAAAESHGKGAAGESLSLPQPAFPKSAD